VTRDHLDDESMKITALLKGKAVIGSWRHRADELVLEFGDGTRIFVESTQDGLEISITGGSVDIEDAR
jgi:hypothetical protein